jgi:hypothetical protein
MHEEPNWLRRLGAPQVAYVASQYIREGIYKEIDNLNTV